LVEILADVRVMPSNLVDELEDYAGAVTVNPLDQALSTKLPFKGFAGTR
jgi:hypothetical protein